jgi:hypothetical protein
VTWEAGEEQKRSLQIGIGYFDYFLLCFDEEFTRIGHMLWPYWGLDGVISA